MTRKSVEPLEDKRKRLYKNRLTYIKKWPEKLQAGFLKSTYGLTWEQYMCMFEKQAGGCAICKSPISSHNTPDIMFPVAHVDHCHNTGKIRGLLCQACNKGIGHLKDNATLCRLAAEYLEKENIF
jgi:hypothetical protein